jgi:hypothetical protein
MKPLSWWLVVFCLLLDSARAGVAGTISGLVGDPSGAFVAGATVVLDNLGNSTKQNTTPTTREICVPGRSGWEVRP